MEADKVDAKYKRMRLQVFLGIFIGYAGFYIVRKNFSMAIPELALLGFDPVSYTHLTLPTNSLV